ncbi:RHS repeat-associated core domain-containing protein [Pseudomonas tremae]|uniref:RHS repeat-associated core domain-containing protein n=2 Tax=Pseudomonas syringae group TaxID=136849 RepID=UPI00210A8BAC|nr:RHS repeat-associated core domain-containing protein [Pseudomonas tremae]MCQ2991216.1 RHS repeat-associated core domain-containing protein [Pseudomonas tremae]
MIPSNQTVFCKYRYDPLDRLASSMPTGQADILRFYQKSRLTIEIQGALRRTVFQHDDLLLAQQRRIEGVIETTLLATDQQRSVLQLVDKAGTQPIAYSPYGHHPAESGLTSLLGFNGERRDPVTGHYLLGNGYRAYNPVLMRFNSPDSLSPFGEGGLNAYGYVGGDPVGFGDETGHMPFNLSNNLRKFATHNSTARGGSIELYRFWNAPIRRNVKALNRNTPSPLVNKLAATTAHTSAGPDSPIASTSRYRAGASSPRGASLSEQELKKTRARLRYSLVGGVSDSEHTAKNTLTIHQNRVADAKKIKEYYRGSDVKNFKRFKEVLKRERRDLKAYSEALYVSHPNFIRNPDPPNSGSAT